MLCVVAVLGFVAFWIFIRVEFGIQTLQRWIGNMLRQLENA
jgi:hypothetical protein